MSSYLNVQPHCDNAESLCLFLVDDPPWSLSQWYGPDVEFLYLVNGADGDRRVGGEGQRVGVSFRVQRTHVFHFLQVDVGKNQLLS